MKNFFKSIWFKITLIVLLLILLAGTGLFIRWYRIPKFKDVTIELGSEMPQLQAFLMDDTRMDWASFVTDPSQLDLTKTGSHSLKLDHLGRVEIVTLTIRDTVAPKAVFRNVSVTVDDEITVDMFVESWEDLAPVTIAFDGELGQRNGYDDQTVTVVVMDESGNKTTGECTISYTWLKERITVELGTEITVQDVLLNPEKGAELVDAAVIEQLNASPAGVYTVTSADGGKVCTCNVTIEDTVAPELEAKSLAVEQGTQLTLESFLVSVSDASNDVTTTLEGDISGKTSGTFPIVIEAKDPSGNTTRVEVTLTVAYDMTAPWINGLTDMDIPKHSEPDYTAGVTAFDSKDGDISFTYDASRVRVGNAGTYYVIYTATDRSGNSATYRRKVTVAHDAEDTNALVAEHAAKCGTTIQSIRNYVLGNIYYNTNWGGDDPVWYGFTNRVGNCYVHALCLQRLLTYHGYTTQLIWVTDRSHYWLIVSMDGGWKHIDATPSALHSKYMFMDDAQRLETLSGRTWDTTQWPACE